MHPNIFSFGLSSVISKVFVADFEHVLVCWERYKIIAALILKYLAQQKNTYSESAETLKQDLKFAKKLTVGIAFLY